jgi:ABC-type siderophore export system fused ATPase/permease subunit
MTGEPGGLLPSGSARLYQELRLLHQHAPDVYRDLMQEKRLDQQHRRRISWAGVIAQTTGQLCGLIALSVLAVVAWHAFNLGDATQGAAIICTGAVSIVAVFVTGRLTTAAPARPGAARDHPAPPDAVPVPVPSQHVPDRGPAQAG